MKTCSRCHEEKPRSEFYKQAKSSDGYQCYCKPCGKANNSTYYKSPAGKTVKKRSQLSSKYGLSLGQFHTMWDSVGGKCEICDNPLEVRPGGYAVDHNHKTGEVRGLLCSACNIGIGKLADDPSILRKAADYLTERGHYGGH